MLILAVGLNDLGPWQYQELSLYRLINDFSIIYSSQKFATSVARYVVTVLGDDRCNAKGKL